METHQGSHFSIKSLGRQTRQELSKISVLSEGLAPVDLLLLMAATENDAPRVAELLRAGADINIRVRHLPQHPQPRITMLDAVLTCLKSSHWLIGILLAQELSW